MRWVGHGFMLGRRLLFRFTGCLLMCWGLGCSDSDNLVIEADSLSWSWVPFSDTRCMDGSSTGLAIHPAESSDRLLIFFEPGGACFNDATCERVAHPNGFGVNEFEALKLLGNLGVFNRADTENPFRNFHFVFVPYCSGDVFGGQQLASDVTGLDHLGFDNVAAYLPRIVATFSEVEQVVVMGSSAGGFGAVFNFEQIRHAFSSDVEVDVLNDSGPPLSPKVVRSCLDTEWRKAWNLDATLSEACVHCGSEDAGYAGIYRRLWRDYPQSRFGLISSLLDQTTRYFFGFGYGSTCSEESLVPADVFYDGLIELQDFEVADDVKNARSFLVRGAKHTWLLDGLLGRAEVQGTSLNQWMRAFLDRDLDWDSVRDDVD